jgi:hypothetical protein
MFAKPMFIPDSSLLAWPAEPRESRDFRSARLACLFDARPATMILQVKSTELIPIVNQLGRPGETGVLRRVFGWPTYGERLSGQGGTSRQDWTARNETGTTNYVLPIRENNPPGPDYARPDKRRRAPIFSFCPIRALRTPSV